MIKPLNGVDNLKIQPIIRKLDNIKIAITPYPMSPLHKMTNQVLVHLQSYNEHNGPNSKAVEPVGQILGNLNFENIEEEDDMLKLERIFNRMLTDGKLDKR